MRAPPFRRQRTVEVAGKKIRMVARRRTIQANFTGWNVSVNGRDFYCARLTADEAFDQAFAQYVKGGGMDQEARDA